MAIRVERSALLLSHRGLVSAEEELAGVKPSLADVTSESEAMKAFKQRVDEFEKIKKSYEELVVKDCAALKRSADSLSDVDEAIGAGIRAVVGATAKAAGSSKSGGGSW